MKPHPGIRQSLKWTGAAATILLAMLWAGSKWWAFRFNPTSHTCVATGGFGVIIVAWIGPPLMTEAEWNAISSVHPVPKGQTYEEFIQASPFPAGYFRRANRSVGYDPAPVWIWPWKSSVAAGEQATSRFIYSREASTRISSAYRLSNPYWRCSVLLWPLVLASGTITALAWWYHLLLFWRARPGYCRRCKYDRTGLAAGAKCPECGTTPVSG